MHWPRWGLTVLLFLLPALCGCGSSSDIAIFCSPDSPRMRQALQGLEAGLGQGKLKVVLVPEFDGRGREELRRLRSKRPRLLVVLGTPALIQVAEVERSVPVVFGLVGNPYVTGAADDPKHPELHRENFTGIVSPPPLDAALEQGANLLGARTWGLLYDPDDGVAVELKEQFLEDAPGYRIKPLIAAGTDAATDRRGLEGLLARGARVIYLPPAPSAARYAPLLLEWGKKRKVMVVSGHPEFRQGAILWVAVDYRGLGEDIAALARRVLAGETPAKIPFAEKTPLKIEADDGLLRKWSGYPG